MITIVAIAISVIDKDPELCARLVNVTVNAWNDLYVELNQQGARLRRAYVEENLFATGDELAAAEDSLRRFQETYGISSFEAQIEGTVSSIIALEQKIMNTTITVEILSRIFQPGHPELQRAKLELQSLLKQKKELQEPSDRESMILPLDIAPELSIMYMRIYRRVMTLEAIHSVLVQQYEQTKMQELRETPAIRIVDSGAVPLYKYRPRRLILMIIASICAFFLTLVVVYFFDYRKQVKGTENYRWLEEVEKHLQSDFQRLRRLRKS
jgi:uncharacterized protein involved in exopolysaccharide biosynthesis